MRAEPRTGMTHGEAETAAQLLRKPCGAAGTIVTGHGWHVWVRHDGRMHEFVTMPEVDEFLTKRGLRGSAGTTTAGHTGLREAIEYSSRFSLYASRDSLRALVNLGALTESARWVLLEVLADIEHELERRGAQP